MERWGMWGQGSVSCLKLPLCDVFWRYDSANGSWIQIWTIPTYKLSTYNGPNPNIKPLQELCKIEKKGGSAPHRQDLSHHFFFMCATEAIHTTRLSKCNQSIAKFWSWSGRRPRTHMNMQIFLLKSIVLYNTYNTNCSTCCWARKRITSMCSFFDALLWEFMFMSWLILLPFFLFHLWIVEDIPSVCRNRSRSHE